MLLLVSEPSINQSIYEFLYQVDLRLDALEGMLNLPITFVSGHIHELRLHVPWTKLGSEPVVITFNTIECVVKVRFFCVFDLAFAPY